MGDIYTNPPQSRNEAILRATIDGIEYTDPPQSRIEDLLLELKEAIEEGGGTGEGDMKKSVYDADRAVQNAGGIAAYVGDEISDLELGSASKKNSTAVVTSSTNLVESGAVERAIGIDFKNLLDVDVESGTDHGVTFTVNADKTITVNGTARGGNALFSVSTKALEDFMDADTDYYLSGLPEGASDSTYCFFLNKTPNIMITENNTAIRRDDVARRYIRISIFAGQTVNNLVFKPMVRKSLAMSDAFAPYHASVEDTLRDAEVIPNKNLYVGSPSFDGYTNRSSYTLESETYNGHEVISKSASWNGAQYPIALKAGVTYTFSTMVKNASSALVWMYAASSTDTFRDSYTVGPNWTRIELSFTPTVDGIFNIRTESATNTKIYLSEYQLEVGSTATEYEPYYVPLKDIVPTKADNSVIGTVEDGTTASQAYAVGSHFIKDGQFKEVTQAIASGGAISDSNTTDKPIANCLINKKEVTFTWTPQSAGSEITIFNIATGLFANRVVGVFVNAGTTNGYGVCPTVFDNNIPVIIHQTASIGSTSVTGTATILYI